MKILSQHFARWILLMLQILMANAARADPVVEAGFIESFNGPVNAYTLMRAGKPVPVGFFRPLYEGDRIIVHKEGNQIQLRLGVNGVEVITQKKSPYTVKRRGKTVSLVTNFMSWLTDPFTRWHEDELRRRELHIRKPRNRKISIPLLERGGALIAGTRTFYLTWEGSKQPYRLRIYRWRVPKPLVDRELLDDNRVELDNVTLPQGYYTLTIRDAINRKARANFLVLSAEELPTIPEELQRSRLPETVKSTLFAAWLAGQDNGKWTFESYQHVAGIAEAYYPARLLRNALEEGGRLVFKSTP